MSLVDLAGKKVVPLRIKGSTPPIDNDHLIPVTNARDDTVVHFAQSATVETACTAADAAANAFKSWRTSSHTERRQVLLKTADVLERRSEEVAAAQALETSCALSYARFMPRLAANILREIAGSISVALTGSLPPFEGEGYGLVVKEPVGAVLCISPWNSPSVLGMRGIASALAAGCTVVLKASEICPLTYQLITDIFEEAGLPSGCLNTIQAGRDDAAAVTEALIAHPAIRKIEFIGSANVGRIIGQIAAKHLKPVLMELGGKGPAIILADANLERAAKACAFGAFVHHGQVCFSTERIIVVKDIVDDFCRLLKVVVESNYVQGVGSAASRSFANNAHSMLDAARQNGAQFLVGDNTYLDEKKSSLRPTIVTGVKRSDKMRDQETFGPSASLYIVNDEAEAIEMANDSAYGLNAAVWTEDTMNALDVAQQLEYGQVHVNSTTVNDPSTLPISGVKGSGWGDNNGPFGITEFLLNKTITLHRSSEPSSFGK